MPPFSVSPSASSTADPSAVPIPVVAAPLPAEWQDWLSSNLVRGCADADLVTVMVGRGFDPGYAAIAVAVVRSMVERARDVAPELVERTVGELDGDDDVLHLALGRDRRTTAGIPTYRPDTPRRPDGHRVHAWDREVRIVFSMTDPHVTVFEGVLSDQECERLIELSSGKLARSTVVDRETGALEVSGVRTSEGTHFEIAENDLVDRLERRLEVLVARPLDHGEPLQILHYAAGGEYRPHHDWFDPSDPGSASHVRDGGQRCATVVVYLNDVAEGGATGFPELGLSVRPQRGRAVYFEYANAAGDIDSRLLHAGEPVVAGDKWIATKWLRERPYVVAADRGTDDDAMPAGMD